MKGQFFAVGLTVLSLMFGASNLAKADPIVIKKGQQTEAGIMLPGNGSSPGTVVMKQYIESASNGELKMEIYGDDSLGNGRSTLEQCQNGIIQMVHQYTNIMAPMVPEIAVTAIPFAVPNHQTMWRVMAGPFGKELADVVLKRTGMRVLSWGEGCGFRNLYSKSPVNVPEDLKKLRVRVPENPGLMAMFQAMGTKTVTITWAEIYTGMQSGTADALETELYSYAWKKLDEVCPYITFTQHGYNMHPLLINEKFFQSLSPKHKKIILEGAELYTTVTDGHSRVTEAVLLEDMMKKGAKVYFPTEEERAKWREAGMKAYVDITAKKAGQEWVDKFFNAVKAAEEELDAEVKAVSAK